MSKNTPLILDSLLLLEQLPIVETNLSQSTKDDIASTIASVRDWFKLFADWMYTSGVGQNAEFRTNNHGSWYVSAYSFISLFTNNQTQKDNAKSLIEKFAVSTIGKKE